MVCQQADVVVWAPGAIVGSLCFLVVFVMHFLPETKGRELPNTVEDIERWYHDDQGKTNGEVKRRDQHKETRDGK